MNGSLHRYSCVGVTEEEALQKHGADHIDVYHTYFKPLEWSVPGGDVC
jgi:hypothetical protein